MMMLRLVLRVVRHALAAHCPVETALVPHTVLLRVGEGRVVLGARVGVAVEVEGVEVEQTVLLRVVELVHPRGATTATQSIYSGGSREMRCGESRRCGEMESAGHGSSLCTANRGSLRKSLVAMMAAGNARDGWRSGVRVCMRMSPAHGDTGSARVHRRPDEDEGEDKTRKVGRR